MATETERHVIDLARRHAGVVTLQDARVRGVSADALRVFAYRHKPFDRYGRGIYMFGAIDEQNRISEEDSPWFILLAKAGRGAYLAASTALDFYKLGMQEPLHTYLRSSSKRPGAYKHLIILPPKEDDMVDTIRGIRVQNLYQAFMECREVRDDYLVDAAEQAWDRNLLTSDQYDEITGIIERRNGQKTHRIKTVTVRADA